MPCIKAGFKRIDRLAVALVLVVALMAASSPVALAEPPIPGPPYVPGLQSVAVPPLPNPPTQPAPQPVQQPTSAPQAAPRDSSPPLTKITDPAAGGVVTGTEKIIKGTALDDAAISRVEIAIQRADGLYWNGSSWTAAVVWLATQITSGAGSVHATWSYPWKIIWSDGIGYKIKARGIDASGNTEGSTGFFVIADNMSPQGKITINSGERSTSNPAVVLTNSITGASRMRFSIDDGATWSAWEDFTPTKALVLTGGAGHKPVQAEFSDGINIYSTNTAIDLEGSQAAKQLETVQPDSRGFLPTPKPGEIRAGEDGKLYIFNAKQGRYEQIKAPSIGAGNWVYYIDPAALATVFKKPDEFSINIKSGWNMVGNPFDRDVVLPKGIVAHLFSPQTGSYWVADTIPEGGGVWIRADKNQTLTLYKKI